ncbi:hypothetical protein [Nostoc sp. 'Peltigera malacea cyanobiont' DB3992]|uniref:hypothetical protein n=1 Tax=Nostoc sp. 'Peltigera malacea cyanobiont' DB3992 TaxID=1206980 RepID=UPI0015D4E684|nr:hypothetical protein [Nostoc sp. 'Peltigera malacea cyanobiont' DB3992]
MQRIIERTKVVPNTYQIGEVCQILAKDNPELRGNGFLATPTTKYVHFWLT